VLAAAREAGAAIVSLRGNSRGAERKADGTPVSAADHAASEIIGERLRAIEATLPVVCEEGRQDHAGATHFWLVDPLDGTREFLRGSDCFSVNIALVGDGFPLFGVIHMPASGETYRGGAGSGAWRDAVPLCARRLAEAGTAWRALLSPGESGTVAAGFGASVAARGASLSIEAMPGAIKFCRLAEGSADLYPRRTRTCAWDTAAGQAILEGAGGAVFDASWQRLRYRQSPGWYNGDFLAVADRDAPWPLILAASAPA
jgi:3'(2'), 5'-bisphosphate nucleotidase